MFIYNFRVRPSKRLFVIFSIMSLTAALACVFCMMSMQKSLSNTATCDEIGEYSLSAGGVEGEAAFLKQFSIQPNADSRTERTVIIPQRFNDTYEQYNRLQIKQGLDLSAYKGESVQMLRYTLDNTKYRYAILLVLDGRVIGAHLTNGEYGSKNVPLTENYGQD